MAVRGGSVSWLMALHTRIIGSWRFDEILVVLSAAVIGENVHLREKSLQRACGKYWRDEVILVCLRCGRTSTRDPSEIVSGEVINCKG